MIFIVLYVLGRSPPMVLQAAPLTLTAAQKAAGQSRGARGKAAAVEDATPSPRLQVTFEMIVVAVFLLLCMSLFLFINLFFLQFLFRFLSIFFFCCCFCCVSHSAVAHRYPPRPRPRWFRRRVGTGRKGQLATTLAAATPRCPGDMFCDC